MKRRYTPNDKIALREYGIDPFTSKEERKLPDHLREREKPSGRKPVGEFSVHGRF